MKRKLSFGLAVVLAVMALGAAAFAASLFTPSRQMRMRQAARDALKEKYGITDELMGTYFAPEEREDKGAIVFIFSPVLPPENKIGQYAVTVKEDLTATASWSLDKEEGEKWTAKELKAAMDRSAAGEEWWEITREAPVLEAAVSEEDAINATKERINTEYGDKLEGDWKIEAWLIYDNSEYSVSLLHVTERGVESYGAAVDAQSGKVLRLRHESAEEARAQNEKIDAEMKAQEKRQAEEIAKAKKLAKLSLEEGAAIAKSAVTATYRLTETQVNMLISIDDEDFKDINYRMDGETPIISCTFRLTQDESKHTTGDGVYCADVNAITGEVVNLIYDTGLGGNG